MHFSGDTPLEDTGSLVLVQCSYPRDAFYLSQANEWHHCPARQAAEIDQLLLGQVCKHAYSILYRSTEASAAWAVTNYHSESRASEAVEFPSW